MNPVTTYTSSDGTVKNIADLNNFHLLNAYNKMVLKSCKIVEGDADYQSTLDTGNALKAEILKRMDNRPQQA